MGWVGLGRDFSVFGGLGWVGSTIAIVLKICVSKLTAKWIKGQQLYWVGSKFFHLWWVGLGWVSQLMGWVGSVQTKWTHGQL